MTSQIDSINSIINLASAAIPQSRFVVESQPKGAIEICVDIKDVENDLVKKISAIQTDAVSTFGKSLVITGAEHMDNGVTRVTFKCDSSDFGALDTLEFAMKMADTKEFVVSAGNGSHMYLPKPSNRHPRPKSLRLTA